MTGTHSTSLSIGHRMLQRNSISICCPCSQFIMMREPVLPRKSWMCQKGRKMKSLYRGFLYLVLCRKCISIHEFTMCRRRLRTFELLHRSETKTKKETKIEPIVCVERACKLKYSRVQQCRAVINNGTRLKMCNTHASRII